MAVFYSHNEEETLAWAENFAKTLHAGDTVLLEGGMGAGKTVIAKGIALGMGITEEVTSPTYTYVNEYGGRLFHFDCYRIRSEAQALALGLADYFERGGVCLVEWAENIRGILPENCKTVTVRGEGGGIREIGT